MDESDDKIQSKFGDTDNFEKDSLEVDVVEENKTFWK